MDVSARKWYINKSLLLHQSSVLHSRGLIDAYLVGPADDQVRHHHDGGCSSQADCGASGSFVFDGSSVA